MPACVLCATALLANASPRYTSRWRAGGLCCVNCAALVPMGVGLGLAVAAATVVSEWSQQTRTQCTFICKVGFGRTSVVSKIEAPNMLANLMVSG